MKSPVKKRPVKVTKAKLKPKVKRRGAPSAGSKERKALEALYKTYNRPVNGGDDD